MISKYESKTSPDYIFSLMTDATYHLIRGTEMMNSVCLFNMPPMLANLVANTKQLTKALEPIVKELDANMDIEDKGDF